jgi:hypothetical protein
LAESLNAGNVSKLKEQLHAEISARLVPLQDYTRNLSDKWRIFGVPGQVSDRLKTAEGAASLLAALATPGADSISVLADAEMATTDTAYGQTIGKAKSLDESLKTADWDLFSAVIALSDQRKVAAKTMQDRLAEILANDEHAVGLKGALAEQKAKALKLLTEAPPVSQPVPPTPPDPVRPGIRIVREGVKSDLSAADAINSLDEIRAEIAKDNDCRLSISWKITRKD